MASSLCGEFPYRFRGDCGDLFGFSLQQENVPDLSIGVAAADSTPRAFKMKVYGMPDVHAVSR